MEDSLIFVDNGFFKLVKRNFENKLNKKIGFFQTFRNICKDENLNLRHLFFYTAPPYQSENPSTKERGLVKNYNALIRMLRSKKWISIREGRCQRLKDNGKFIYRQKGVDILLAMDLMKFEKKFKHIKKIILIACDSDFVPAIEELKRDGIEIILYTYFDRKRDSPFSRYNELLNVCSRWVRFDEKLFRKKLLKVKNG
jgi:uncharacterized LabA/DUF88 family protein